MNEFKKAFNVSSAHAFYAVLLAVALSGAAWIRAENAVPPDNAGASVSAPQAQTPST